MSDAEQPIPETKVRNYRSRRGAEAYKADYEHKLHRKVSDQRERRIFTRFFRRTGRCESILDIPCGAGRLFSLLQSNADRVIEADFSPTMLELNASDHDRAAADYLECSALAIPLPDGAVDAVVSVRLSHHLESQQDRERHLQELARVARRYVMVTWFSHESLKNRLRQLRAPFNGKQPKNTLRTARVIAVMAECGFCRLDVVPLSRIGSGHAFGLFERVG